MQTLRVSGWPQLAKPSSWFATTGILFLPLKSLARPKDAPAWFCFPRSPCALHIPWLLQEPREFSLNSFLSQRIRERHWAQGCPRGTQVTRASLMVSEEVDLSYTLWAVTGLFPSPASLCCTLRVLQGPPALAIHPLVQSCYRGMLPRYSREFKGPGTLASSEIFNCDDCCFAAITFLRWIRPTWKSTKKRRVIEIIFRNANLVLRETAQHNKLFIHDYL